MAQRLSERRWENPSYEGVVTITWSEGGDFTGATAHGNTELLFDERGERNWGPDQSGIGY